MSNQNLPNRVLLLGVYGMEMVECGGALLKNANNGGVSHASMLFCGPKMKEDLEKAAKVLKTSLEFLDMDVGKVSGSYEEKLKLVKVIREFKPDIIITQDPEHSLTDFDPGRRPVMNMILEAIALSSRNYAIEECGNFAPHRYSTLYFMSPENPNCLLDIYDVWDQKCEAMDLLESQLEFCGKLYENMDFEKIEKIAPGFNEASNLIEKGKLAKKAFDKAYYLYHGSTGHNHVIFSESYRREGLFVFDNLVTK